MKKYIKILFSPELGIDGGVGGGGRLPPAQIKAITGQITYFRIQDVDMKYGPPSDQIDVELIVKISSNPNKAFGFKLRKDANEITHLAMLNLLKNAFDNNIIVTLEYRQCYDKDLKEFNNSELYRVIIKK